MLGAGDSLFSQNNFLYYKQFIFIQMKPILIDDFIKQNTEGSTSERTSVTIDGVTYNGYQLAKPLNYDPEFLSLKERREMANAILKGKAIAVRYFCDMTEKEQIEYVKTKINK